MQQPSGLSRSIYKRRARTSLSLQVSSGLRVTEAALKRAETYDLMQPAAPEPESNRRPHIALRGPQLPLAPFRLGHEFLVI